MKPHHRTNIIDAVALHKIFLALCDALAITAGFYLSFRLRNYLFAERGGIYEANLNHSLFLIGLIPLMFLYFRHQYLYRNIGMHRSIEHLELLSKSWLAFYGFFLAAIFFLRVQLFWEHRITMFLFLVLGWFFLFIDRFMITPWLIRRSGTYGKNLGRVLCITTPEEAARIRDLVIQDTVSDQHVAGYLDDSANSVESAPPRLGAVRDLEVITERENIVEAYLRLRTVNWNDNVRIIRALTSRGVRLRVAMDQFGALRDRVPMLPETDMGYLYINNSPLNRAERKIKTLLDSITAALLLILLLPVFVVVGLAIRLESSGPVFFRQKRAGREGQTFEVFKFRTMSQNTEAHHKEAVRRLIEKDHDYLEREGQRAGFYKLTHKASVTRFGAFLRKTSLDELPQLINVLRGEMSLVGPRPLPLYEVELFQPWQHYRHEVRPGITGFWQVFGRSAVSHEDTILMDIYYIMNWSLTLDLRILIRTVFVLMTGKGAL